MLWRWDGQRCSYADKSLNVAEYEYRKWLDENDYLEYGVAIRNMTLQTQVTAFTSRNKCPESAYAILVETPMALDMILVTNLIELLPILVHFVAILGKA